MRFNEIDRNGFNDFMKRYFNDNHSSNGLRQSMDGDAGIIGPTLAKKNFDEIDRSSLTGLKRNTRKVNDLPAINEHQQALRKD